LALAMLLSGSLFGDCHERVSLRQSRLDPPAVAVLAVACLLVFLEFRGRSILERFVSRIMQPRLVRRTSLLRRLSALALVLLAMIVLVCALMRPQWGMSVQRAVRVDSQIMICLDVSKSMLAEDVAPSRLERAKIELDSLLGLLNEGQQVA